MAGVLGGCTSDSPATASGGPSQAAPGSTTCAAGFTALPADRGCTPVVPEGACPAGSRPAIGSTTCEPVGVTACAPGFVADESGWGCEAVLPPVTCAIGSGTREQLGSSTCVPVADCDAAFPPPGTTHHVSAAYADGDLDATHFRTLGEAVEAAPANAVVAVDTGTYAEQISLHRAVRIVGRCPQKAVMQVPTGVIGTAISIGRVRGIAIEGLGFRGYNATISVLGGTAALRSLVIEDGLFAGVIASNANTEITIDDVVVRGTKARVGADQAFGLLLRFGAFATIRNSVFSSNEYMNVVADDGVTMTMARSVVRDGKPLGKKREGGVGFHGSNGGLTLSLEETAIVDNAGVGMSVASLTTDEPTSAKLTRSVVRRTALNGEGYGRGIEVNHASLVVSESTLAENGELEAYVIDGGTLDLEHTTLHGVPPARRVDPIGSGGLMVNDAKATTSSVAVLWARYGMDVEAGGELDVSRSFVGDTGTADGIYRDGAWIGPGIIVSTSSRGSVTASTVAGAHGSAILAGGATEMSELLVQDTVGLGAEFIGGRALQIYANAEARITRSAFLRSIETAVSVENGGSLDLRDSTIQGTRGVSGSWWGQGLLVLDSTVRFEGVTLTESDGVGALVSGGSARVRRSWISANAIALHVQAGTSIVETEAEGPLVCAISPDTRLVDNQTRVGSGLLPLPPTFTLPE